MAARASYLPLPCRWNPEAQGITPQRHPSVSSCDQVSQLQGLGFAIHRLPSFIRDESSYTLACTFQIEREKKKLQRDRGCWLHLSLPVAPGTQQPVRSTSLPVPHKVTGGPTPGEPLAPIPVAALALVPLFSHSFEEMWGIPDTKQVFTE